MVVFHSAQQARVTQCVVGVLGLILFVLGLVGLTDNNNLNLTVIPLLLALLCIMVVLAIDQTTPALCTADLQNQQRQLSHPSATGNKLIKASPLVVAGAPDRSPFYDAVQTFYSSQDVPLPFPLGLAHHDLTQSHRRHTRFIQQVDQTIRAWYDTDTPERAVWLDLQKQSMAHCDQIRVLLQVLEVHPSFHPQYQSMMAYRSAKKAQKAQTAAESAAFWAMMSFCCRRH